MAHLVESMLFVGQVPWHGLGTRLEQPPSVVAGIQAAGLDWDVGLRPLATADTHEGVPAFATYRTTDATILGVVGPHYQPLQNRDAFTFFEPFLRAGEAQLHTAGSLAGGRRVWVLAKVNRRPLEVVPGDQVEKYVLLSNSHDGTLAVRVGFTPVRVVCNNTLAMAHGSDASRLLRVKHTKNVVDNLAAIREVMDLADQQFAASAEQFQALARRDISRSDLDRYVRVVLGLPSQKDQSTRAANIVNRVGTFFEAGRGNAMPRVRGTWWAAYNAITEYLSYERGRSADSRLNSLWFGDGARINHRALSTALTSLN
jgi:phage/plasmid-like protein (TIGR03299 family)